MPTRTRHGYTRCPDCRRHARAPGTPSQFVCPFCSGARRPSALTRSAMLAGALALAGCGASEAEPSETPASETPEETPAQDSPQYEPADDPAMVEAYGAPPQDDPGVEDTPGEEPSPED